MEGGQAGWPASLAEDGAVEGGQAGWPASLEEDVDAGELMGGSLVGGGTVQYGWPLARWGSVAGGGLTELH